jgi:sec-independent protein translocase protein TatC
MQAVAVPPEQYATMSFGDHLEELRRRLILALIAPLPLSIIAFFFSARLIEVLLEPLFRVLAYHNLPQQVQALSPPEMLLAQLKLSIIFGLVASSPWIPYGFWMVRPDGVYQRAVVSFSMLLPGNW